MPIRTTGYSKTGLVKGAVRRIWLLTVLFVHINEIVAVPIGGQTVVTFVQMACTRQDVTRDLAEWVEVDAYEILEGRVCNE